MPSQSLEVDNQIDQICDLFESEWKKGNQPNISDFLHMQTELPTETLLEELVQIDIHYRKKHGETPNIHEYAQLFPEFSDALLKLSALSEITIELEQRQAEQSQTQKANYRQFGRYELHKELGHGGFGVVWKAWDTGLKRWVAAKVARVSNSREIRRLFHKEAQVMASLSHPNIVRVIDFGIEDNLAYIISDLIDGQNLSQMTESTQVDMDRVINWIWQTAEGLEHVHNRGIIHRDLKPSNLLLARENRIVITDFGLARDTQSETTILKPGEMMGTPPYMSPEQIQGLPVDKRTDIYSLGVVLYKLMTGQRPYDGSRSEMHRLILEGKPKHPREINPEIPPSLAEICLKAMARLPQHRYQSLEEMKADLQAMQAGETVIIRRPLLQKLLQDRELLDRRTLLLSAGALGTIGLGGILYKTLWPAPLPSQPSDQGNLVTVPIPAAPPAKTTVPVSLTTDPPGAKLVIHPVNYKTGRVQPEHRIVVEEVTPVELELRPGDYLVVAYFDDGRFHEVYRHVRDPQDNSLSLGFNHFFSKQENGQHLLPRIKIPQGDLGTGMSRIPGMKRFGYRPYFQNERFTFYSVPEFFVDQYEFTQGERRGMFPEIEATRDIHVFDGEHYPLRSPVGKNYTFDHFVSYAESLGKRLLTDIEFYYVASNGGTTKYPWGNEIPAEADKVGSEISPVGQPEWDRTQHELPVYGLCSGVAEWVDAQPAYDIPGKDSEIEILPVQRNYFIIKGGTDRTLQGDFRITEEDRNPRSQITSDRGAVLPGLGSRFARSERPRLKPEDFLRALPIK